MSRLPGRDASNAKCASWRARHSAARSSVVVDQRNSPPPFASTSASHRRDLLVHLGARPAVELEEERVRLLGVQAGVGVHRADRGGVQELAARDRDAGLHDLRRRPHAGVERRERAARRRHPVGDAVDLQRQLGDDPERPLRAHEQVGEVVAGRTLARGTADPQHPAVGEHHRHPQHVRAHRAVADRGGAGGAGRRHAPERGVRAGIHREEQALPARGARSAGAGERRPPPARPDRRAGPQGSGPCPPGRA